MKIALTKNIRRKWFWKLISRNGRILAHSEDYSSHAKALKTARSLAKALVEDSVVELQDPMEGA